MDKLENLELEAMIKDTAKKLNIAPYPMCEVKKKVKGYYDSNFIYVTSGWKIWYDSYIEACIVWSLNDIRKENPIENQMYLDLERCKKTGELTEAEIAENDRVSKIIEMLSEKKIFLKDEEYVFTLHQVLKWLTLEQCEQVKKCILILKDYCDVVGICSVLEGANVNVTKKKILIKDPVVSDLTENEKKYQPATFVRRLELMTRYIRETADKDFSETEKISENYWLRSTGSDPHCEGRHALFLVNKSTNEIEYVYKPHDLSADNAVVGEDGMFAVINRLLPKDKNFVTVHIAPEKHLETYVKKLHTMDKEKAKAYFYQAGMLQVITDAMAVTDLHQDNIMPTEDGPLIIDAEVDFFRANFSGLLSALTWDDRLSEPRTACFSIDEGNGKILRSGVAFQNEKSIYRTQYKNGQEFMLGVINDNIDYLFRKFDEQLRRITKSRILPFSTKRFSDDLQRSMRFNRTSEKSYVPSVVLKYEEDYKHSINELASDVINNIKKKFSDAKEGYIFTGKAGVYFREYEFVQSIMETFENGTIIAMYIDMDGNIYIDDTPVGYLCELGDKSDESPEPPRKLSRKQVIKMIKDHFIEKIENYDISNGG